MLPAESILRAAKRWLRILQAADVNQGWALIRAVSEYADLTTTQYASALEWLKSLKVVVESDSDGGKLSVELAGLPESQMAQILFEKGVEYDAPPWLPDADILIPDASEIPNDAADFALSLGVPDAVALSSLMHLHGKIDLEGRGKIGLAGEKELVRFLEEISPGSTTHVALHHDGFGYDIVFRYMGAEWHIEVKSTTRRGRLAVYLSRHEHEIGLADPRWRLVVLGLNDALEMCTMATVRRPLLIDRSPNDVTHLARWQSVLHQLGPEDITAGLVLDNSSTVGNGSIFTAPNSTNMLFAWMPGK